MNPEPYTLIINRFDSRCGHCGRGALMSEHTHETVPGYNPGEGCHVRWVLVSSDYTGMADRVSACRPDLTWVGFDSSASSGVRPTRPVGRQQP